MSALFGAPNYGFGPGEEQRAKPGWGALLFFPSKVELSKGRDIVEVICCRQAASVKETILSYLINDCRFILRSGHCFGLPEMAEVRRKCFMDHGLHDGTKYGP